MRRFDMFNEYSLSAVFCAVNESESLMNAFGKINNTGFVSEFIFVLSQNATADCLETVKKICIGNNQCRYIVQKNKGLGCAIREGIDNVKTSHMIIWPADDGMDASSFPEMVEISKNNPESIVTVSRWLEKNGFQNYGKVRKIINYFSQKLFSVLYRSKLTDYTNPTQIAPISLYRKIRWEGTGFEFIPEMIFKPLKLGFSIIEVPCRNTGRRDGKSNSNFFQLCRYYFVIIKILFMKKEDIFVSVNDR